MKFVYDVTCYKAAELLLHKLSGFEISCVGCGLPYFLKKIMASVQAQQITDNDSLDQ